MNLQETSKQIEKTCKQVRKHFTRSKSSAELYRGFRNEKIMPYVIRFSNENRVNPAVIYQILGF